MFQLQKGAGLESQPNLITLGWPEPAEFVFKLGYLGGIYVATLAIRLILTLGLTKYLAT